MFARITAKDEIFDNGVLSIVLSNGTVMLIPPVVRKVSSHKQNNDSRTLRIHTLVLCSIAQCGIAGAL